MTETAADRDSIDDDDTKPTAEAATGNPVRRTAAKKRGAEVTEEGASPEQPADTRNENGKKTGRKPSEETRRKRRPLIIAIGVAVVALLAVGGIVYWLKTRNLESTDDAYTDGRAITIAAQVPGTVLSLDVTDNQFVKKDQLLIHIDPRQYINDRDQAEGALATAKSAV